MIEEKSGKKTNESSKKSGMKNTQSGIKSGTNNEKSGMINTESGMKSGTIEEKSGKKTDESSKKSGMKNTQSGMKSGKKTKTIDKILDIIREDDSVTISHLSTMFQINTSAIQRHIDNLRAKGIIRRDGADKGGKWVVIKSK
jgi:predicted HTH transcriptional regulator